MISNPDDRMAIYETTRELVTARKLSRKAKNRIVRRLLLVLGDRKILTSTEGVR